MVWGGGRKRLIVGSFLLLVAFLLLVVRPGAPIVASLLLVAMPFAPSSVRSVGSTPVARAVPFEDAPVAPRDRWMGVRFGKDHVLFCCSISRIWSSVRPLFF